MTGNKPLNMNLGLLASFAAVYLLLYLLVGILPLHTLNAAPVWINDTAYARVNITNFVPQVVGLVVYDSPSPDDEIDLSTGTIRKVWCNGTVVDNNGADDIVAANATIFFVDNSSSDSDDRNEHYTNSSCETIATGTYNKTYSCTFAVWYYANNGTWNCNMSAWDNGTANLDGLSAFNSSTDTSEIQPLYALDVPSIIEFGELTLGATSGADVIENVTNIGNMDLDLQLYGYGGTITATENNLSMICSIGNISVSMLHFDFNSSDDQWASMTNLSGQFANPNSVDISIAQRISETLNSTNNTYWKIRIPQYSVKGECNGTVVFTATENA